MEASTSKTYHLFECIGIELEYMIVNTSNLTPQPITDEVIIRKNGQITDELSNGPISWSNELVLHVIELKTSFPAESVENLSHLMHQNVLEINNILAPLEAKLLPTAMHPLLNPMTDVKLWPHHRNEIYEKYNEIFNCKGHGWGNLQSMHINLPFGNDEEFYVLHEAIRHLMPLIPALSASSPLFEGGKGEFLDNRLAFYEENQKRIPSIAGKVIPESVKTKKEYEQKILQKLYTDIEPFDKEGILQEEWLNSRGAITRFDRNAIEIRIIDLQECPKADLAIAELVVEAIKVLVKKVKNFTPISENNLYNIYRASLEKGSESIIDDLEYLKLFDPAINTAMSIKDLWKKIITQLYLSEDSQGIIHYILENGNLSQRILKNLSGSTINNESIIKEYQKLAECLNNNMIYHVK
ncbi:glutamate--cysteine ligase [Marivirga sp. S37H4]|uniref:Glutamate--cysteine ligase n=1 Tax=Marivirga aurantiaca TaxID=2802615 RepID=A0A934WYA9_9BACT|nr:glutamate-cysteine ligase family protein [Marivirga aurantiaca]MBK6265403.1 glutamate--cysteine ligase [Marivirga aurantiaca]